MEGTVTMSLESYEAMRQDIRDLSMIIIKTLEDPKGKDYIKKYLSGPQIKQLEKAVGKKNKRGRKRST